MQTARACDIAIIGSGLVGSALACALEGTGLSVALVEAQPRRAPAGHPEKPGLDCRNLALARRSVETLTRWGVWQHAQSQAQAIRSVHVSRRGDFGALRLAAGDLRLDAFGETVPAPALGSALEARLSECRHLLRLQPARLQGWEPDAHGLRLSLASDDGDIALTTRLLVAADGSDSKTRALAGIDVQRHDYAQTAIVGAVALDRDHAGRAFERFIDDGLVALLPMASRAAGFVWVQPTEAAASALQWDDSTFLAALQQVFGNRLGTFRRAGARQAWPLHATTACALTAPRVVLLGNAAQTVHPVGAQGFNLGLRDAVTLAEELVAAHGEERDPGSEDVLQRHASRRQADRAAIIESTAALVTLFGSRNGAIRLARSAALTIAERVPVLKRGIARRGMGFSEEIAP